MGRIRDGLQPFAEVPSKCSNSLKVIHFVFIPLQFVRSHDLLIETHITAHSTWWQSPDAVFFAGLIHHAQLKCSRTEMLTNSLSFDNSCSETCWLPASACCRLIWLVMISYADLHPFTITLYHQECLPVLCAKDGEEKCHLLLFPLSALGASMRHYSVPHHRQGPCAQQLALRSTMVETRSSGPPPAMPHQ